MNMKDFEDFLNESYVSELSKIKKIISTCTTIDHVKSADNAFQLWKKKWDRDVADQDEQELDRMLQDKYEELKDVNEGENLRWKNIFGKEYTHEETLKKNVIDGLVQIVMDENQVSEKSFKQIDKIIDDVKEKVNEEVLQKAEEHLQSGKRMKLFYEIIYDELQLP